MAGWSDLPEDMLRLVARRLMVAVDRVRFSAVCKNWLQFASSEAKYLPCPPPWLMLAENSGTTVREFAGVTAGKAEDRIFELDFPGGQGTRCVGSFGLWVITVNLRGEIHLQNPFTGKNCIDLPPLSGFEDYDEHMEECELTSISFHDGFVPQKVAISASLDSGTAGAEVVSMAIYNGCRKLAFSDVDHQSWVTVDHKRLCFYDVAFFNGKFYGVDAGGVVFECDLDGPKMMPISDKLSNNTDAPRKYLVEWSGMLLQVLRRYLDDYENNEYQTLGFDIYKLEFDTKRWIKLNDLGRYSLFVGVNTAVAVSASEVLNLEPNCIYFTDDWCVSLYDLENGRDMGVFNLADGSIKPHYRGKSFAMSLAFNLWNSLKSATTPKAKPCSQA